MTNADLVALLIRTRRQAPTAITLDADAPDDPVHGRQRLRAYHGYFRHHRSFPWLVYAGASGFPVAAGLRPGTGHARGGATAILTPIVTTPRAAGPGVRMTMRADNGLAVPALDTLGEAHDVRYRFGSATDPVPGRAPAQAPADAEWSDPFSGRRAPHGPRFEEVRDDQAGGWPHPRRRVAQSGRTPRGSRRRSLVTERGDTPALPDRGVYVQRGAVAGQPIGEMRNGVPADRLSACGFRAHAFRLPVPSVASAVVVVFREAVAAVAAVATAGVATLRPRLGEVGAVLRVGRRRVWLQGSARRPQRAPGRRGWPAVPGAVGQWTGTPATPPPVGGLRW